jgi:hypothetical protein
LLCVAGAACTFDVVLGQRDDGADGGATVDATPWDAASDECKTASCADAAVCPEGTEYCGFSGECTPIGCLACCMPDPCAVGDCPDAGMAGGS